MPPNLSSPSSSDQASSSGRSSQQENLPDVRSPADPSTHPPQTVTTRRHRVHSHSKLKTLEEEHQRKIIGWLAESSYSQAVVRVRRELGVQTSIEGLRIFRSWWLLGRHLANLSPLARCSVPPINAEPQQLAQALQAVFLLQAYRKQDVNGFCRMRQLQQTDQRYRTDEAQFKTTHPTAIPIELTPEQDENETRKNFRLPLLPNVPPPPSYSCSQI